MKLLKKKKLNISVKSIWRALIAYFFKNNLIHDVLKIMKYMLMKILIIFISSVIFSYQGQYETYMLIKHEFIFLTITLGELLLMTKYMN